MFGTLRSCPALVPLVVLNAACTIATPQPPDPEQLEPDNCFAGEQVEVTIRGQSFFPRTYFSYATSGSPQLDLDFTARLDETTLVDVTFVDSDTLRATVPAGLAPGTYALQVEDPRGQTGTLADAFIVHPAPVCDVDANCDDQNPCTDDSCIDQACQRVDNAALCDDELFCTAVDTCAAGACVGAGDPCPSAICDEVGDACVECLADPDCVDDNPCTDQACSAGSCTTTFNSAPCDDGLFCTAVDECSGGTCAGSADPCPGATCDDDADLCVGEPVTTFVDDFGDGTIGPEWTVDTSTGCTAQETSGRIQFNMDGSTACLCSLTSVDLYDLSGSFVAIDIPPITSFHPEMWVFLEVIRSPDDRLVLAFNDDAMHSRIVTGGAETFYQASSYSPRPDYWRIREDLGTIYFETSLDGMAWDLAAQSAATFEVTAVALRFGVETTGPMASGIGIGVPSFNSLP